MGTTSDTAFEAMTAAPMDTVRLTSDAVHPTGPLIATNNGATKYELAATDAAVPAAAVDT